MRINKENKYSTSSRIVLRSVLTSAFCYPNEQTTFWRRACITFLFPPVYSLNGRNDSSSNETNGLCLFTVWADCAEWLYLRHVKLKSNLVIVWGAMAQISKIQIGTMMGRTKYKRVNIWYKYVYVHVFIVCNSDISS